MLCHMTFESTLNDLRMKYGRIAAGADLCSLTRTHSITVAASLKRSQTVSRRRPTASSDEGYVMPWAHV